MRAANRAGTAPTAKLPFGDIPKGPMQIFVSINQQKLHLYSNGEEVAETLVATGVPQHPTPTGAFSIVQKQLLHHSNIYSGAPMPFMERITWSGVALHEGVNLGHPASHGCIRMSHDFAVRLYAVSKLGAEVFITDAMLAPQEFADAHLFVHKDPSPPVPVVAAASVTLPATLAQNALIAADAGGATVIDAAHDAKPAADVSAVADVAHDTKAAAESPAVHDAGDPAAAQEPARPASASPAPIHSATANPQATPPAPAPLVAVTHMSKLPIAIFISRKTAKIYVRQDFEPVFSAPVTIEKPDQPLGTLVFTALQYLPDRSGFVWNVVAMPGERPRPKPIGKIAPRLRPEVSAVKEVAAPPPPESPEEALARIQIPQDAIDRISQMIVPGSSLTISDQGLGDETGEGTNFVVVMH